MAIASALVTPEQMAEMAACGRLRSPREACGVLARGALAELPNRSSEDDLAWISKQDLEAALASHQDLRREELIFWHTHPGGFVGPSRTDLQNRVEGFSYLVVTLNADGTHTATAY